MTTASAPQTRTIQFGTRTLELGGPYLGTNLVDSAPLLRNNDFDALRERMKNDGYLLIRGFHPRETVLAGRRRIFEYMQQNDALKPGTDPIDGIPAEPEKHVQLMGKKGVTQTPQVLAVIESPKLMDFYSEFFQTKATTFDYKWMRAVKGGNTGAHMDIVYMGRGTTEKLITCWTPFGDIPIEHGTLAVLVGSHNLPSWQKVRDTYGKMDVDRDRVEGWFCNDPVELVDRYGGHWETTDFHIGDILMFGMWTVHSSTNNTLLDRYRLSTDTRYQPANEPIDERWVGSEPKAHYQWYSEPNKMVKMTDKRKEWGV